MSNPKAYMYVLTCSDGSLYTGYTTDIERRLKAHNAGKEANMLLIEAIKDGSTDGMKILPPLIVHQDNGDYTDDIFEIYFGQPGEKHV